MRIRKSLATVALAASAVLVVAGCSSAGGAKSSAAVNLPHYKFAMITHQAPGDTFWDIIRKGAAAAAAKDNIDLVYSNDQVASNEAVLIQNAIDQKVDGIAVTLPTPDALIPEVKKAQAAGIPVVAFNAGFDAWKGAGIPMYFGQDETLAGQAVGKRLSTEGAKHALCVVQQQGQVQLEARCAGVTQGLTTGTVDKIYVNGADMPSVQSTITAKLQQDPSIDYVVTLGAPIALTAVQSVQAASSKAKVVTFDTNKQLVSAIQSGSVQWAVDQQPYVQGYESIDALWLYKTNGDVVGGGNAVLTGPAFIDSSNIAQVAQYAANGTR
ncbi:MAG TPA: substrate-binding domain-containing protein [Pseudonocardiaceae bacterium]|jgi:simple sugar transport system substrate-binding protein|nr:substrate-binding domain-containing protein [Pseudonocardiaceae bacterium]